jgi:hypothetical protein
LDRLSGQALDEKQFLENFILWNLNGGRRSKRICFYATSLGLQQINRGSREMLGDMLRDWGFEAVDIDDWAVRHMATDYLSDERDSEDWRDRWMSTWEIEIQAEDAVALPARKWEVPTLAHDKTYGGEEQIPAEALVVADFKSEKPLDQLVEILGGLGEPDGGVEHRIRRAAAEVKPQLVRRLSEELARYRAHEIKAGFEYEISQARKHQLFIHIAANREFFEGGASLAVAIEALTEQLGGSTFWRSSVLAEEE